MSEMKKVKGLLIRSDGTADFKTLDDDLETYYRELNCDCIDITTRFVGKEAFSVTCDDEALCRDDVPSPTMFDLRGNPMIFGNVFITRREGPELASLTENDERLLRRAMDILVVNGQCRLVLVCDYRPFDI